MLFIFKDYFYFRVYILGFIPLNNFLGMEKVDKHFRIPKSSLHLNQNAENYKMLEIKMFQVFE